MTSAQQTPRDDPARALPEDLPREFRQFDTPVTVTGVGAPGKVGLVELEVARQGNVSRIVHRYQQAPL